MLYTYFSEHLQADAFVFGKLFFKNHLISDVKTTLKLRKLHCENLWTFPCSASPLQSRGYSKVPLTSVSQISFPLAVRACPVLLNLDLLYEWAHFQSARNLQPAHKFAFNQQSSGLRSWDQHVEFPKQRTGFSSRRKHQLILCLNSKIISSEDLLTQRTGISNHRHQHLNLSVLPNFEFSD